MYDDGGGAMMKTMREHEHVNVLFVLDPDETRVGLASFPRSLHDNVLGVVPRSLFMGSVPNSGHIGLG